MWWQGENLVAESNGIYPIATVKKKTLTVAKFFTVGFFYCGKILLWKFNPMLKHGVEFINKKIIYCGKFLLYKKQTSESK
jgi:hypothetical protein